MNSVKIGLMMYVLILNNHCNFAAHDPHQPQVEQQSQAFHSLQQLSVEIQNNRAVTPFNLEEIKSLSLQLAFYPPFLQHRNRLIVNTVSAFEPWKLFSSYRRRNEKVIVRDIYNAFGFEVISKSEYKSLSVTRYLEQNLKLKLFLFSSRAMSIVPIASSRNLFPEIFEPFVIGYDSKKYFNEFPWIRLGGTHEPISSMYFTWIYAYCRHNFAKELELRQKDNLMRMIKEDKLIVHDEYYIKRQLDVLQGSYHQHLHVPLNYELSDDALSQAILWVVFSQINEMNTFLFDVDDATNYQKYYQKHQYRIMIGFIAHFVQVAGGVEKFSKTDSTFSVHFQYVACWLQKLSVFVAEDEIIRDKDPQSVALLRKLKGYYIVKNIDAQGKKIYSLAALGLFAMILMSFLIQFAPLLGVKP